MAKKAAKKVVKKAAVKKPAKKAPAKKNKGRRSEKEGRRKESRSEKEGRCKEKEISLTADRNRMAKRMGMYPKNWMRPILFFPANSRTAQKNVPSLSETGDFGGAAALLPRGDSAKCS